MAYLLQHAREEQQQHNADAVAGGHAPAAPSPMEVGEFPAIEMKSITVGVSQSSAHEHDSQHGQNHEHEHERKPGIRRTTTVMQIPANEEAHGAHGTSDDAHHDTVKLRLDQDEVENAILLGEQHNREVLFYRIILFVMLAVLNFAIPVIWFIKEVPQEVRHARIDPHCICSNQALHPCSSVGAVSACTPRPFGKFSSFTMSHSSAYPW